MPNALAELVWLIPLLALGSLVLLLMVLRAALALVFKVLATAAFLVFAFVALLPLLRVQFGGITGVLEAFAVLIGFGALLYLVLDAMASS